MLFSLYVYVVMTIGYFLSQKTLSDQLNAIKMIAEVKLTSA